ncbi:MAG: sugar transferase [Candidatus Omnitrophica bacterium]|nr:sugar transferase [Candidatus Omnitrophota bacterium]
MFRERYLKRTFDIIISMIGIIVLSPLLLLLALLIKLEGIIRPSTNGPVIHSEIRISKGRPFGILKFRTVRGHLLEIVRRNPQGQSQSYIQHKPGALTYMGKFLTKYYLDELPQVFNILKGEMTFVGPRPQEALRYKHELKEGQYCLRDLRSGLCGLAQASKRNSKLRQALIEVHRTGHAHPKLMTLDTIYFSKYKKYSDLQLLFYDIKVMAMTLRVNFRGEGV